ncbi:DNA repair protein RecO [Shewanella sp. NIFS-20-20]|uniref:DNA repair protein RecO n=1 Tax=Shewanella sp. NIFS-20-20 TaxID=2853806 RepID=UPI001C47AA2F|nr:DNA repair protein RecO [Shewanella sp. NIFS-20-20]MBV7314227.1 DNA repair protein RecO [Shewanella sp. NIFS-20-20]
MHRGYILHQRPYRENSVILHLLIDGVGRVDAIARQGQGKRSQRAILQLFQPLLLQYRAKSELATITSIEAYAPAIPLQGQALYAGMYLNEILYRCLKGQTGESLFVPYHQSLMAQATQIDASQLRYFELSLLAELGGVADLSRTVDGTAIANHIDYQYIADEGLYIAEPRLQYPRFSGSMLLGLQQRSLSVDDAQQARNFMRLLLQPFLGDKPLQSRLLFTQTRAKRDHNVQKE